LRLVKAHKLGIQSFLFFSWNASLFAFVIFSELFSYQVFLVLLATLSDLILVHLGLLLGKERVSVHVLDADGASLVQTLASLTLEQKLGLGSHCHCLGQLAIVSPTAPITAITLVVNLIDPSLEDLLLMGSEQFNEFLSPVPMDRARFRDVVIHRGQEVLVKLNQTIK